MKTISLLRIFLLPALMMASAISAFSQTQDSTDSTSRKPGITISLITCWPGDEVYELCGHEAVRVRGEGIDSVWNYGTFDFNAPNFLYRFVKGETDYMLSSYPFIWFMPEYRQNRRHVVEQELNLTQDEAERFLKLLRKEALPQNRTYRYNYVRDNCATRIVARLDEALGKKVIYTDSVRYGTFRQEMRTFHVNYPWYQFGIDLALGSGIDMPLKGQDEMFVPLDMMQRVATARTSDGRPLVRATHVLNEGIPDATLPPTPWWGTPVFWSVVTLLLTLGICVFDGWKKRISRPWWTFYFGLCGLAGCVVAFLTFISEHEATSPNALIVWLNPLQLLTSICIWWRRLRHVALIMNWYNLTGVGILMLLWPFQPQSANPAFFPLMACAVVMGGTYAIIVRNKSLTRSDSSLSNAAHTLRKPASTHQKTRKPTPRKR